MAVVFENPDEYLTAMMEAGLPQRSKLLLKKVWAVLGKREAAPAGHVAAPLVVPSPANATAAAAVAAPAPTFAAGQGLIDGIAGAMAVLVDRQKADTASILEFVAHDKTEKTKIANAVHNQVISYDPKNLVNVFTAPGTKVPLSDLPGESHSIFVPSSWLGRGNFLMGARIVAASKIWPNSFLQFGKSSPTHWPF